MRKIPDIREIMEKAQAEKAEKEAKRKANLDAFFAPLFADNADLQLVKVCKPEDDVLGNARRLNLFALFISKEADGDKFRFVGRKEDIDAAKKDAFFAE